MPVTDLKVRQFKKFSLCITLLLTPYSLSWVVVGKLDLTFHARHIPNIMKMVSELWCVVEEGRERRDMMD